MTETRATLLKPGAIVKGRYQIARSIGRGGMAEVFEALDLKLGGKRVALKALFPHLVDGEMMERFRQESSLPSRIDSDNVVDVQDRDIDDDTGIPFFVMELLEGEDLERRLERGRLSVEEAIVHLSRAASALECAHAADIVHRDLKPANLFVTMRRGGLEDLKVLDFGVAKIVADGTHPSTTGVLGTPLYMSPEQILGVGDIGPASDVYSLGHVAFTLLVGKAYWEHELDTVALAIFPSRVALGAPESGTLRAARFGVELPAAFDQWFARATAVVPSERYDSTSELVAELAAALGVELPFVGRATGGGAKAVPRSLTPSKRSSRRASADHIKVHSTSGVATSSRNRRTRESRSSALWIAGVGFVTIAIGFAVLREIAPLRSTLRASDATASPAPSAQKVSIAVARPASQAPTVAITEPQSSAPLQPSRPVASGAPSASRAAPRPAAPAKSAAAPAHLDAYNPLDYR